MACLPNSQHFHEYLCPFVSRGCVHLMLSYSELCGYEEYPGGMLQMQWSYDHLDKESTMVATVQLTGAECHLKAGYQAAMVL